MANSVIRCCINTVKYIPVIFITAILVWSYYAYVIQLCILTIENIVQKIAYIIIFHVTFVMVVWSYVQTIFTKPSTPSNQFFLSNEDIEKFKAAGLERQQAMIKHGVGTLPVSCKNYDGSPRFCRKCYCYKPDRAHHCSTCGICILKMDHHCPWVNNCVNFSNYKFFVLFLGYALVYCLWIGVSSLQYFIMFWRDMTTNTANRSTMQIVFLTLVGFMFSVSVLSLLGYHIYLVAKNKSTLESFQVPIFRNGYKDKRAYDLGCKSNFVQIFGARYLSAILPIHTSQGDGEQFAMSAATMAHTTASYQSMACTPAAGCGLCPEAGTTTTPGTGVAAVGTTSPTLETRADSTDDSRNRNTNSSGDGQSYPMRQVNEVGQGLLGVNLSKESSDSEDGR